MSEESIEDNLVEDNFKDSILESENMKSTFLILQFSCLRLEIQK